MASGLLSSLRKSVQKCFKYPCTKITYAKEVKVMILNSTREGSTIRQGLGSPLENWENNLSYNLGNIKSW